MGVVAIPTGLIATTITKVNNELSKNTRKNKYFTQKNIKKRNNGRYKKI